MELGAVLGHTVGMTRFEKIAISLPAPLVERARRAVRRGEAASVSAYVARALEQHTESVSLDELLGEMLAQTGGPLSHAEAQATDRELGLAAHAVPKRRRKRR